MASEMIAAHPIKIDLGEENSILSGLKAEDILIRAADHLFPGRLCVVSSFGAEAVVLLHLISQTRPEIPVIFLNTGKLFPETLRYRDRLQAQLNLMDVRSMGPSPIDLTRDDADATLWSRNTDQCCAIRKVKPQERATHGFSALITGRKKFQTRERAEMNVLELNSDGRYRLNPLANWSLHELKSYIETHDLPRHPLVKDGYLSIGCQPCTRRVQEGEDYRAGRWAGSEKEECGIHLNIDGDGI